MLKFLKHVAISVGVKAVYIRVRNSILKWRGLQVLDSEGTNAFMQPYSVKFIAGNGFELPQVINCADKGQVLFETLQGTAEAVYVWDYRAPKGKRAHVSKFGSVVLPNQVANVADVMCLKRMVAKWFKPVKTSSDRIYIRRASRRRVANEDELIAMLKRFGFVIVEDVKRSVTDQITMYHNASFIMGAHGASFSNIIWCDAGTHLFELFSPNYQPEFYLYLATVLGLKYSAYSAGEADAMVNYFDGLQEDIHVSVPELEACLQNIFNTEDNTA